MSTAVASQAIEYDARSFIINGKRVLLVGGEYHYFRTPHALWEDRIVKMKRSGANLVTTYIPWNWHEPREGRMRWTGDQDLVAFIELCGRHDMHLVVKPGPYICAEWDFGGHPDWLLQKRIPLRVLNKEYLAYVRGWYRSVAEKINPYLVTRGGNIVCIQVENEYDHLMHYGEDPISVEDAIAYFTKLGGMLREFGVDVPQFANEAAFLRGGSIIDTRTYYPNIPLLGDWRDQHGYFDGKILAAKEGQPDAPTMILELQVGWFSQFGRPHYVPGTELTESVSKSVLMLGASVLNYYMFVGGTTFPYWGCRGNNIDGIQGLGSCTTFDFGGAPIREWGELMPGRRDGMKAFMQFCQDYRDLLLESDVCEDFRVLSGGEDVQVVRADGAGSDTSLSNPTEHFTVMTKRRGHEYLVCVRNLGRERHVVNLGRRSQGEPVFHGLEVGAQECFLLPVSVRVPDTDITVVRSTSELLFATASDDSVLFGCHGKKGRRGETVLDVPAADIEVLEGDVDVGGGDQAVLSYTHEGMHIVKVRAHLLLILDHTLAGKVEKLKHGVLIADTYYVQDIQEEEGSARLTVEMRNGSTNRFRYVGRGGVKRVTVSGEDVGVVNQDASRQSSFVYPTLDVPRVEIAWQDHWRIRADAAEVEPEYDDRDWRDIILPCSLEDAGLFDHGYTWYRGMFNVPEGAEDVILVYPGNETDRQHVYVNGHAVWSGITRREEISISAAVVPGANHVAVLYANNFHNKSHPHEGAIQKHSGIQGPVVVLGSCKGRPFSLRVSTFKVRQHLQGRLSGFAEPDCDVADWIAVPSARKYVMAAELGRIVWMRRSFSFNRPVDVATAVRLTIPRAGERCTLYVNGRPLGQYESVGPQEEFYLPETFLRPENVLAIVLEGVGGYMVEPVIDTFYEARRAELRMEYRSARMAPS